MEILVQQINPWVTEQDLYNRIATALHTPPVRLPGDGLTNFRLLLPKTNRDRHKGYAFVTIAETSTASAFLQYHSGKTGRPLDIVRDGKYNALKLISNGFGAERVVQDILRHSFETWEERQRRLRGDHAQSSDEDDVQHHALLTRVVDPTEPRPVHRANVAYAVSARSEPTRVVSGRPHTRRAVEPPQSDGAWNKVEFGVICEDGKFSIEDFDRLLSPLPSGFDVKAQVLYFGNKKNAIRILFNNIVAWSIDRAHNALAFELEDPATFILDGRNSTSFDFIETLLHPDWDFIAQRERKHYRIPAIACHFRVCFVSTRDLDWFCLEARPFLKRAGNPRHSPRPIVRRNLTDPEYYKAAAVFYATLDIKVAYQFEKLFRNALYSPTVLETLKSNTRRLIKLYSVDFAARVLESLAATSRQVQVRERNTKCLLASFKLQERINAEEERLKRYDAREIASLEELAMTTAVAQVFHVTVTPTRTLLEGPFMDASNRVLRLFPEFGSHFLRVAFCDEDGDRFPVSRLDLDGVDSESFVHERIGGTLKHGITIAGRVYSLLAWSGSGLGSHHCWFVTPFTDKNGKFWDAERIRQSLGNFSRVEKQPARFGARLSQAFSATSSTIRISDDWIKIIRDDYSEARMPSDGRRQGDFYLLTDGVGQISRALLNDIWRELCTVKNMRREWQLSQENPARVPSAIQFRCGGAKGVLCLNPKPTGKQMIVRDSMIKFSAPEHRDLEVAATSFSALPARLNRPLINALEDLGVKAPVFLSLQQRAVENAQSARRCFKRASKLMGSFALSDTAEMHRLFRRLDSLVGVRPDKLHPDGILNRLCTIVIAAALGDLKRKARIPVDGSTLIGVVDEFGYLARGQIFAQVDDYNDGKFTAFQGQVMIGRSPTIHPGDVRVVTAVAPPPDHPLWQLRNVVVFSKSPSGRPLQSMLSGGDLDGDLYTIYKDPHLYPEQVISPGQYKNVPPRSLARSCTAEDLADFFVDYIINDQVGLVSTFHLQIADKSELHSLDPDCIKLAQLHAKAVDYRKTGQAVHRKEVPMPRFNSARPDFLAQRPAGPNIYASPRALGQLYRAIPEQVTDTPFGTQPAWARGESNPSALTKILKQPGKSDDILSILSMLAQKYPQIMPEGLRLVQMQEHFRPLMDTFVFELSKLAAWIPESRTETEWLSEEEILIGTQVMACKAKQLKRRQERLTSSTAELFPILRAQLQLIAGNDSVETGTIRPDTRKGPAKTITGRSQSSMPGKDTSDTVHFTGYAQVVPAEPRPRPKPRIVVVDGERVVLRERPDPNGSPSPWSDDSDSEYGEYYDIAARVNRAREKYVDDCLRRGDAKKKAEAATAAAAAAAAASSSRSTGNGNGHRNGPANGNGNSANGQQAENGRRVVVGMDHTRSNGTANTNGRGKGKGKGKAKANGSSNGYTYGSSNGTTLPNGSANGKSKTNSNPHSKGKNRAIACTDPELYQLMYDSDDSDYSLERHYSGRMSADDLARRKRRKELRYLYSACYLGATEASVRSFGGNTFAVVALGCLLELIEEHQSNGRLF